VSDDEILSQIFSFAPGSSVPPDVRMDLVVDVASGEMTKKRICEKHGLSAKELAKQMQRPEFTKFVDLFRRYFASQAVKRGIGDMQTRLLAQNKRWERLHELIESREAYFENRGDVPGGSTGLIVEYEKKDCTEYSFDAALLKEIRELELLAAKELGQHVERVRVNDDGSPDPIRDAVASLETADPIAMAELAERILAHQSGNDGGQAVEGKILDTAARSHDRERVDAVGNHAEPQPDGDVPAPAQ
jgi:hypothetical protein